jgi:hypothetical protein
MKPFSSILVLALALHANAPFAVADPAKVDYSRRNPEFAPGAARQPQTSSPEQAGRFEFPHRAPSARATTAAPAARFEISPSAPVRRDHARIAPEVRRERATPAASRSAQASPAVRPASAETRTFGLVEKFQPRSSSAAAVRIGRTPSLSRNGTATLNRFIFRRTQSTTTPVPRDLVRAGGGADVSH